MILSIDLHAKIQIHKIITNLLCYIFFSGSISFKETSTLKANRHEIVGITAFFQISVESPAMRY